MLCALADESGEIHVEYLAWMDSLGGSWSHSEVQSALMKLAPIYGLRVYRVNAAKSSTKYPGSDEIGKESGREVVFEDGWIIDRDYLADVNLASRPEKKGEEHREVDASFRTRKPRRGRRVRRPAKSRRCLGDLADQFNDNSPIDYSLYFFLLLFHKYFYFHL